ncbi:MAG TPA: CDP-diacylglycerol--glycerol-3-phosphate 3-phosphatidyltransferase [Bacillota bacterium]|nr:CDP-diacylglycerol--glycerol-3-phosphate 3-phosphatidyltransferase [Bacillota bacterium]
MNLANRLTLARIFLVPIFMMILISRIPYGKYLAAVVFIIAASTDGLDGYIARKRNMVTKLGKFMDPLADKLLVTAAMVSLVELQEIPAWVAVIIIGRELAVTGLRAIIASDGVVIAASKLGKYKTVSQIVAIVALFMDNYPFRLWGIPFGTMAMTVAVVFTLWSGLDYFLKARHLLKVTPK